MLPKVSIIIPCFNALPFIKQTLESAFNQTYNNIEIIVVDDGSEDGTIEFLKKLGKSNLIVKSNIGKGACAARNYGLQISTGDYIQFLDADDLLSKDKIQNQVRVLAENENSIAVCSTKHFYNSVENGKITDTDFLYSTDKAKEFLLNLYGANGKSHNMVQTSAWLAPKTLIEKAGNWEETLSKDQDGEFFCRVVSKAERVIFVPNVLNYYRKHINGTNIGNQKQRKHIESQLKALRSKSQQFDELKNTNDYKNAMALQYKIIAINAYPRFKDLSKLALRESSVFGGSDFLPVLGGKLIESVKHIFGWKAAKSLTYWVHK